MKLTALFTLSLFALIIMTQFQNCGSAKDNGGRASLRIQIPKTSSASGKLSLESKKSGIAQAPTAGFDIWGSDVRPLAVAELNCFGVAIGGFEGDADVASNRCEDLNGSPTNFGIQVMGLQEASNVSLEVPSGSRVINILAWHAEDTEACSSLGGNSQNVLASKLSRPIRIAQVPIVLVDGPQSVSINASLSNGVELAGCNIFKADANDAQTAAPLNLLGGTVSGLDPGQTITLGLDFPGSESASEPGLQQAARLGNIVETITVGNGPYFFATNIEVGQEFNIALLASPNNKICEDTGTSFGVFDGTPVTNIDATCSPGFTAGGSVSGLAQGEQLLLNILFDEEGGSEFDEETPVIFDQIFISDNGPYTSLTVPDGSSFFATIVNQPNGQHCRLGGNLFGSVDGSLNGENVTDLDIVCAPLLSVGGEISGFTSGQLDLELEFNVESPGQGFEAFSLTPATGVTIYESQPVLPDGSNFNVRIVNQPATQTCSFDGASGGNLNGSSINNINLTCVDNSSITISGTVQGLQDTFGGSIDLRLQVFLGVSEVITVSDNFTSSVPFSFNTQLTNGQQFTITPENGQGGESPPPDCVMEVGGSGTAGSANIDNVLVVCSVEFGS